MDYLGFAADSSASIFNYLTLDLPASSLCGYDGGFGHVDAAYDVRFGREHSTS